MDAGIYTSFESAHRPSAKQFAMHLAKYIASPTKIEALVIRDYGEAPPLHKIADWRFQIEQHRKRAREWERTCGTDRVNFADYQMPSLIRQKPRDVTPLEEPLDVVPEARQRANPFLIRCGMSKLVVASVAADFKLTADDITGPRRFRMLVDARATVTNILRATTCFSYPQIGRLLGDRDHSTIIHHIDHFSEYRSRNPLVGECFERHMQLYEEAEAQRAAMLSSEAA